MKALRGLLALLFGASATDAAAQPAMDGELVTGVVDARGAAGSQVPPDTAWTLHFSFAAWRGADGIIRSTPLNVRGAYTYQEMQAVMDRINTARLVSARVRHTDAGSAELIELVDVALPVDDPLHAHAAELEKPVTREDERFGTLTLDRGLDWWEGTVPWGGDTIGLALSAADEEELAAALRAARTLWDDQAGWSERIQAFAVQELLPVKNDGWLEEGEQPACPCGVPGPHAPEVRHGLPGRELRFLAR
jgi:hypothetical protein